MPQPQRTLTDASGASWLVLDNGHRIRLPDGGSGSGGSGGSGGGVTSHGDLTGLEADDHPQYALLTGARPFSGMVTVPDLKITGMSPEPGLVWTAEDTLGAGAWQEPSALVVAETSDPVLINWYDQSAEGWVQYSGAGTMAWAEIDSPSMPGAIDCTGDVWAEWRAAEPMVFEPGALYRVTVRARLTSTASLSFGFQCYDAATPAGGVDTANGSSSTLPHWCAVTLTAGDSSYVDPVQSGEWLAWTGYLSGKAAGVAEGLPGAGLVAPAEAAVLVASGVSQWRPAFHATGGQVWVDAVEIHRLDRSLELPGGIRASDVYAQSVNAISVTTENFKLPPSTDGYVLTAVDEAGNAEWQYPPIAVTEGEPVSAPENPLTVNLGPAYGKHSCAWYAVNNTTTITSVSATAARVPGSKAVQFTLVVPAMVTARATYFLYQSAASGATMYAGIGVEDANGAYVYPDDWAAASVSAAYGSVYMRSTAVGYLYVPGSAIWKRHLQPGTYTVFPRAWLSAVDASSTKQTSIWTMELEVDPNSTYFPGQRP